MWGSAQIDFFIGSVRSLLFTAEIFPLNSKKSFNLLRSLTVMTDFLEVDDVTKRFGPITALDGVSFEVEKGDYFVVLGPIGSGRTTMLKCIAGLLKPDSGSIRIGGRDVTHEPPENRGVSFMPPGYALFPHLTVWDNVAYGPWIKDLPRREVEEKTRSALEMVGLLHRSNSYPHELSGGQRQRVALARALASGVSLLLLDEPLSALDAIIAMEVRSELKRLTKEIGLTVVHTTHNREEALAVADEIVVLRRGRVEQIDEPEELYSEPETLFVASFVGDFNLLEGLVVDSGDGWLLVDVAGLGRLKVKGKWRRGERVVVSINPLAIRLGRDINVFRGVIEAVSRSAVITRLWVRVGEVKVKVNLPSREAFGLDAGREVTVSFPVNVTVYPYPARGLVKALEA